MKNILKSVAALACIALVCTGILAVVNKFWYVPPKAVSDAAMTKVLKDSTSTTFDEVEITPTANVLNVYVATNGNSKGAHVALTKAEMKYGFVEMLVGVKDKQIVGVDLHAKKEGIYDSPFTQEVYDYFVGKNPASINSDDLSYTGPSSALTAGIIIKCVNAGFDFINAMSSTESPELIMAKKIFPDAVECVLEHDDTALKIKTYLVTFADATTAKIYFCDKFEDSFDTEDGDPIDIVLQLTLGVRDGKYAKSLTSVTGDSYPVKSELQDAIVGKPVGTVNLSDSDINVTPPSGATHSNDLFIEAVNYIYNNCLKGGAV